MREETNLLETPFTAHHSVFEQRFVFRNECSQLVSSVFALQSHIKIPLERFIPNLYKYNGRWLELSEQLSERNPLSVFRTTEDQLLLDVTVRCVSETN